MTNNVVCMNRETICPRQSIRVEYNPGDVTPQMQFQWNTGESTPYLDIYENGNYRLQVIPGPGQCAIYDEVDIKILEPTVGVHEPNKILCEGTSIILKPDVVPTDPLTPLFYNWDDGASYAPEIEVQYGGTHKLVTSYETTQRDICKDSVIFNVIHTENPHVKEIGEITTSELPYLIDMEHYISSPDNYSYIWTNEAGEVISETAQASLEAEGNYVSNTTEKTTNCHSKTTAILVFTPPEEEIVGSFFIPNILSPFDSDENNSSLRVYGEYLSSDNFSFEIFNRWGQIVFSTTDLNSATKVGWTGNKNNSGDILQSGSYTYSLNGQYTDGSKFSTIGSVTLLR